MWGSKIVEILQVALPASWCCWWWSLAARCRPSRLLSTPPCHPSCTLPHTPPPPSSSFLPLLCFDFVYLPYATRRFIAAVTCMENKVNQEDSPTQPTFQG